MSINSINIKLPQLETVQLKSLHQGDAFMLSTTDNLYKPDTTVYMLTQVKPFEHYRECVRLDTGEIVKYPETRKVVRLKVTMECKYCLPNDDDGLPF